jgi:hypothetical protein
MTLRQWCFIHPRSIRNQSCKGIPLLPKVLKGAPLEVFNEKVVLAGEPEYWCGLKMKRDRFRDRLTSESWRARKEQ